jgi:hypothetical protein
LSVDGFELLPEPVQAALQQSRLQSVFIEAARLAADARLNASTTKAIIRDANAAASEADARALIDQERQARAADITTMAAGFKRPRCRSASAAPHLAALMKYKASDFTDVPPDKVADAIIRMEHVHAQLGVALAQFRHAALMPVGVAESHGLGTAA